MLVRHRRRGRIERSDGEAGESLIELVIAVVIIGLGVVALLGTLFSVVYLTNRNRGDVQTAVSATDILERIQAAPYEPCSSPTTGTYVPYLQLSDPTPEITIEYLVDRNSVTPTFASTCTTDQGVQRIKLRVARGFGRERRVTDLVMIKRDDRCPASVTTSTSSAALQRC